MDFNEPAADFDDAIPAPEDPLGRVIRERRWGEGVKIIEARLANAATPEKRGFYHSFLATFYKTMIRDRRHNTDPANVERLMVLAEDALERAIVESPRNIVIRNAYAEFHLKYRNRPEAALGLLDPFSAEDFTTRNDKIVQDHKRLTLRGFARALRDDLEGAAAEFNEAYGERFQRRLERSYKTPLWLLARRGVRFPAAALDPLIENLGKFPLFNPASLDRLRASLIAD